MARRTLNVPFQTEFTAGAAGSTLGAIDLLAVLGTDAGIETRPGMTIVRIRGIVGFTSQTTGLKGDARCAFLLMDEGETDLQSIDSEIVNAFARVDALMTGRTAQVPADTFDSVTDAYLLDSKGNRKIDRVGQEVRVLVHNGTAAALTFIAVGTIRVMLE